MTLCDATRSTSCGDTHAETRTQTHTHNSEARDQQQTKHASFPSPSPLLPSHANIEYNRALNSWLEAALVASDLDITIAGPSTDPSRPSGPLDLCPIPHHGTPVSPYFETIPKEPHQAA